MLRVCAKKIGGDSSGWDYSHHRIAMEHLSTKANPGLSLSSKVTLACGGFHVHSTRKTTGEIEADPRRGGGASRAGLLLRENFGFPPLFFFHQFPPNRPHDYTL